MVSRSPRTFPRISTAFGRYVHWMRGRGLLDYRRARIVSCDRLEARGGDPAAGVDVREASDRDLRELAETQGLEATPWLARSGRGVVCLMARSGGTPLGYVWITRAAELMTEVDQVMDVSRDPAGAYMFDGFVLPPYRNKGVLRTLLEGSKRWALEHGISRLYAAFTRDNRASERALLRAGFVKVVGDVALLRILHREWKWIRFPRGIPIADVLTAESPSRSVPRPT